MKKFLIPIIYIFLFMAAVGFSENMRGPFVTLFKSDFNVSDKYIGILLMVSSIGYIAFQYIGGRLIQKFSTRLLYFVCLVTITISFLMMYISPNFIFLLAAMFIFNAGISLFAIVTNSLVPLLFVGYQAVLMNITHFCYGFGTTIGQRFAGLMLERNVSWRSLYLMNAFLFAVLIAAFFFIKFPSPHMEGQGRVKRPHFRSIITNKLVILYIFAIGFYVFSEVGLANWFSNFLINAYDFNKDRSSFYLSLFFGIFALGRLLGGFIVEKTGHFKALIAFLSTAFILFIIGLVGGRNLIYLISISGFFFSIAFPTLVVTVNEVFKEQASFALGTIMTFASTVNMLLNLLTGFLNDTFGVLKTFYLIPASLFVSIITIIFIIREKDKDIKIKA